MSKKFALLVLLAVTLLQAGCSRHHSIDIGKTEQTPNEIFQLEGFHLDATYTPIDEYVDLSDSFSNSDGDPFAAGEMVYSLTCANQSAETYMQSEERVSVRGNLQSMTVFCTWGPQDRTVFLGLKHAETGVYYILPSVGGSIVGVIDLNNIPDGEYYVVLCSNDNPSTVAVLHYQIS